MVAHTCIPSYRVAEEKNFGWKLVLGVTQVIEPCDQIQVINKRKMKTKRIVGLICQENEF